MTTPTDLAQALRELASDWRNKEVGETCDANAGYNRARKHCAAELEKVLKAHESRAHPPESARDARVTDARVREACAAFSRSFNDKTFPECMRLALDAAMAQEPGDGE